jgi:hypothetical protein
MLASGMRTALLPFCGDDQRAVLDVDDAPALRAVRGQHRMHARSAAKKVTAPGQAPAMAATIGSAAFSTAMPSGATFCTMTRLTTARSSTVLM